MKNQIITTDYKGLKIRYNSEEDINFLTELVDSILENYSDEGFKKFDFTKEEYIEIDGHKYDYIDNRLTDYVEEYVNCEGYCDTCSRQDRCQD